MGQYQILEGGFSLALYRFKREHSLFRKLDVADEASLMALICGEPPEDSGRWTLRVLTSNLVWFEIVENISNETVQQTLKNAIKPHLWEQWVILSVLIDKIRYAIRLMPNT